MGNSNNRCCEVTKEEEFHSDNYTKDDEKCQKKCTTFSDVSKLSDAVHQTDHETKVLDKSTATEHNFKPDMFNTPLCAACQKVITSQNQNALLDPRSPTNGIMRTPLCLAKNASIANVEDPRSPTVGIARTPIVKIEKSDDIADTNVAGRNLHDPRSPTVELYRTPLKFPNASENLRRSVLLTNTLLTSPSTHKPKTGSEKSAKPDVEVSANSCDISIESGDPNIMESLKPADVLNLDCLTNLNSSLSSSMAVNIDSEGPNINIEEELQENEKECSAGEEVLHDCRLEIVEDVVGSPVMEVCSLEPLTEQTTTIIMDTSLPNHCITEIAIENPPDISLESSSASLTESFASQTCSSPSQKIDEKQCKESNNMVTSKKSQIPSTFKKSNADVRQKRSLALGHHKSLSAGAETKSSPNVHLGENHDNFSSLHKYSKLRCVQDKSSIGDQNKLKENIKKTTLTQSIRSPLAVLGNSNSPTTLGFSRDGKPSETRRARSNVLRNTSRVPRYKGNNALMRSKTVGLSPSGGLSENMPMRPSPSRQVSLGKEN